MKLSDLKPAKGARRARKRVGRGSGSGTGTTAGRGTKGQKSRSGSSIPAWFEGGQMPIQRRLPKRGFHNPFRVSYQVVNLKDLSVFAEGADVNRGTLLEKGLIRKKDIPVKLLGKGTLSTALKIEVDAFSESAGRAVAAAGGTITALRKVKSRRRGRPGSAWEGKKPGRGAKAAGKSGSEGKKAKSKAPKAAAGKDSSGSGGKPKKQSKEETA